MSVKLDDARELKRRIRAMSRRRFAIGIALTAVPDRYRIAIVLASGRDRRFLQASNINGILRRYRHDIDIEVAGAPHPAGSSMAQGPAGTPLRIGASVGHHRGGVGSLGFFARRRSDGRIGLVSCNHVIAMVDAGRDGDAIVSPSSLDGGRRIVASLDGSYPRLGEAGVPADCAFAALQEELPYDAASVGDGELASTLPVQAEEMDVAMVARATNGSAGRVMKIEVDDLWIRYGSIRVAFHHVIQIGSATTKRFCEHGDSGALVYATRGRAPVGLLFATSSIGGPYDAGLAWVHPMQQVTEALGVDFINA